MNYRQDADDIVMVITNREIPLSNNGLGKALRSKDEFASKGIKFIGVSISRSNTPRMRRDFREIFDEYYHFPHMNAKSYNRLRNAICFVTESGKPGAKPGENNGGTKPGGNTCSKGRGRKVL